MALFILQGGNLRHRDGRSKDLVRDGDAPCKSVGSEETSGASWGGEFM